MTSSRAKPRLASKVHHSRRSFMGRLALGAAATAAVQAADAALRTGLAELESELQSLAAGRDYWRRLRREFDFHPGLIHLNCATIGACPRLVLDTVTTWLRHVEGDPVQYAFGAPGDAGERAAEFLGATRDELLLTRNTTEGMNAIAMALRLQPGDEVLTTNHEHPSGSNGWMFLARHYGIKPVFVEIPAPARTTREILDLIAAKLTDRTRVCSFSHVETLTGLVMPLADIAKLTRPRGILLVCDGAQAPGMLAIDVKKLDVDTYASSSHKWMLAPKGSGLLYVRKEAQPRLPLPTGFGQPFYSASGGTQNVAGILGHAAAMAFHQVLGRKRVEARCRELSGYLRKQVGAIGGVRLLSPADDSLSAPGISTFAFERVKSADLAAKLYQNHHIQTRVVPPTYGGISTGQGRLQDYNALRISTHIFNDESEIDRLAKALEKEMAAP